MNTRITTDVIIVGAGPAGMLLAKILKNNNIGCLLVERRRMKYVLSRIRAGVIEKGSVELLNNSGVGDRLKRECQSHNGFNIYFGQNKLRIKFFCAMCRHTFVILSQGMVSSKLNNMTDASHTYIETDITQYFRYFTCFF